MTDATETTRALIADLFARYEEGDSGPFFEHVADDVRWTVMGRHPLAGAYTSKQEFLDATYERLARVLAEPVRPTVTRIIAAGEWAVVQWRGTAPTREGEPYDNVFCWVIRVVDGRITEVTAYLDSVAVVELFESVGEGA